MIGVDARANKGTRAVVVFLTITLVVGVALLGRLGYQLLGAPTLQLNALKQAALPPTAAATATPVPAQPTSPAPGVAAAPTADPCANAIRDGSLEEGTAWSLVETVYSAAYIARPATYVSDPVRAGSRALRLGIDEGTDRYSYSSGRDHPRRRRSGAPVVLDAAADGRWGGRRAGPPGAEGGRRL